MDPSFRVGLSDVPPSRMPDLINLRLYGRTISIPSTVVPSGSTVSIEQDMGTCEVILTVRTQTNRVFYVRVPEQQFQYNPDLAYREIIDRLRDAFPMGRLPGPAVVEEQEMLFGVPMIPELSAKIRDNTHVIDLRRRIQAAGGNVKDPQEYLTLLAMDAIPPKQLTTDDLEKGIRMLGKAGITIGPLHKASIAERARRRREARWSFRFHRWFFGRPLRYRWLARIEVRCIGYCDRIWGSVL